MRKMLVETIILIGLFAVSASVMAAPVVTNIEASVEPAEPEAGSTVTITATITCDDIIDGVSVKVKECYDSPEGPFCYLDVPYTMTEISSGDGEYQYRATNVKLSHMDAEYMGYWFIVNSGESSYDSSGEFEFETDYVASDNQQDSGADGGSPGFEMVLMLISIAAIMFILKRKR